MAKALYEPYSTIQNALRKRVEEIKEELVHGKGSTDQVGQFVLVGRARGLVEAETILIELYEAEVAANRRM
jgi:hypothetical protein